MDAPIINIYAANHGGHHWVLSYLHGKAEDVPPPCDEAPDSFTASMPMPTEPGAYPCNLYGQPAVAVIGMHCGRLGGRVALVTDIDALKHVLDVAAWR